MQGVRRAIRLLRIPSARECQLERCSNPCLQRTGAVEGSAWYVSEFLGFGSRTRNGSQLHNYGYRSQVRGISGAQAALQAGGDDDVPKTRPGGDPQRLHEEILATMEKKVVPQPGVLSDLIRASATASEVALAMDAAARLRAFKKAEMGEKGNHSREVTHMMVAAYLRAGNAHNALKLLWRKNSYGFVSSIGSAHLLLKHAKFHKNVTLMQRILRAMAANEIRATPTTADIILRTCKEGGETELMFALARDHHREGVTFHESLFDVLISSAANAGDVKLVYEIQSWRDAQGLVHTIPSAVSIAKALVLEGKSKDAAVVIRDHCPDTPKRERYLSIMVKVWPLQLIAALNVESREDYLGKLKDDVGCLFDSLKELGLAFSIDVSGSFAQGKGSSSAAQKEVKSTSIQDQESLWSQSI